VDLSDPVAIGRINAAHGVRGTVKVKALGSGRHLRAGVRPVVDGERREILHSRETPKGFLVDLEGITDRSSAGALRGAELLLDRSELDEPEEDEFYVSDLVGLEARDTEGKTLGTVADTFETPTHEVLIVRDEEGGELYVPFTLEHVLGVLLREGSVVVDPSKLQD
jgi:16S rRNA processing protein RimM